MNKGVLELIAFSLLTGFGGYFAKISQGINPQQILFFRAVLACFFLLVVATVTKRIKELKFRYPLGTMVMGLVEGISIYFYYLALTKTTITNTMLLIYTAPVFSVILAAIFLKEKIEQKTIWGILASFLGVVIVSNIGQFRLGSDHLAGSIYALLGGFFYSAMAISSKTVSQKTTPLYAAFWQYLIIMVAFAALALPTPVQLIKNNITPLLYLGWAAGGLAFILYMEGIKHVKGQIIQVITMLELVVGSLSGILLLGEKLTLSTLIGGTFIIAGIFIVSAKSKAKG
jgi:drug/metabolite transporter (DMT)-like permease